MNPNTQPKLNSPAFSCPYCGVFSKQEWCPAKFTNRIGTYTIEKNRLAKCVHCNQYSIWVNDSMVYPLSSIAPTACPDMPDDVKDDFNEARDILAISPRGATALLRLAIQKLCKHLGGKGENINDDISNLVKNGIQLKIQQALDSVRVIGNNAVHPGQIDLKNDFETAYKLFGFINVICENQITQPNAINEFYEMKIPTNVKEAISKRDE